MVPLGLNPRRTEPKGWNIFSGVICNSESGPQTHINGSIRIEPT